MWTEFQQVVDQYKTGVDSEIKSFINKNDFPMYDMMRYHMGWMDEKGHEVRVGSGKMIRSTLCLLACEAVGANQDIAIPAAGAVELLHNYSLIHDDVVDESEIRDFYDHLNKEVRASHILIKAPPNASPEERQKARAKIDSLWSPIQN